VRSLIFQKAALVIVPVVLLFAFSLLLRGHDAPGGGFSAGVTTLLALLVLALGIGPREVRERFTRPARPAMPLGLAMAIGSAGLPTLLGRPFFARLHFDLPLPGGGALSLATTLSFDVGVFLVVVGAIATALSIIAEPTP